MKLWKEAENRRIGWEGGSETLQQAMQKEMLAGWRAAATDVPPNLVLGPLLFNIFLATLVLELEMSSWNL